MVIFNSYVKLPEGISNYNPKMATVNGNNHGLPGSHQMATLGISIHPQ